MADSMARRPILHVVMKRFPEAIHHYTKEDTKAYVDTLKKEHMLDDLEGREIRVLHNSLTHKFEMLSLCRAATSNAKSNHEKSMFVLIEQGIKDGEDWIQTFHQLLTAWNAGYLRDTGVPVKSASGQFDIVLPPLRSIVRIRPIKGPQGKQAGWLDDESVNAGIQLAFEEDLQTYVLESGYGTQALKDGTGFAAIISNGLKFAAKRRNSLPPTRIVAPVFIGEDHWILCIATRPSATSVS